MGDSPKNVNFQVVKENFLKIIFAVEVFQRPKMQFSRIYTQRGGSHRVFNFQCPDRWNFIGLVPEKLVVVELHWSRPIKSWIHTSD